MPGCRPPPGCRHVCTQTLDGCASIFIPSDFANRQQTVLKNSSVCLQSHTTSIRRLDLLVSSHRVGKRHVWYVAWLRNLIKAWVPTTVRNRQKSNATHRKPSTRDTYVNSFAPLQTTRRRILKGDGTHLHVRPQHGYMKSKLIGQHDILSQRSEHGR
ncbi:unnamed protein product [Ectocarpus fasciculatus]